MKNNMMKTLSNKENFINKIIIAHKNNLKNSIFGKKDVLQLLETLSVKDEYILNNIINDKCLGQYINNVLSKMYLNNDVFRIQRGIYSFSSNLIDFKISLEKELSNRLIKNLVVNKELENSEAVILEKNIFVPELLTKEKLSKEEREIFFRKFKQYKLIKMSSEKNEVDSIELISLAKFYNKKNSSKDYLNISYSLLESYFNNVKDKLDEVFANLLKYTRNNEHFNYSSVNDFVLKLKKEIQINVG
ncbi:MAG: hypothetical protein KFW07_04100 [Mycoplasmataceae bacterium]|nr:hypothetical protein [Mycoplasmataceae bacterium]